MPLVNLLCRQGRSLLRGLTLPVHIRQSLQGLGLWATEGPLRSCPKATYVLSWTWQVLRVTSQFDLKTAASSMNFNSPFPNSYHRPQTAQFRYPHQRVPLIESSKAIPFGPSTVWLRRGKEGSKVPWIFAMFTFKGTLFAEGVILYPHTLFSLVLKEFDEANLDPF